MNFPGKKMYIWRNVFLLRIQFCKSLYLDIFEVYTVVIEVFDELLEVFFGWQVVTAIRPNNLLGEKMEKKLKSMGTR